MALLKIKFENTTILRLTLSTSSANNFTQSTDAELCLNKALAKNLCTN